MKTRFLIVLTFFGIALLLLGKVAKPDPSREELLNAASGADRIEISPARLIVGTKYDVPPLEIQGKEAVQDFLDLLEVDLPASSPGGARTFKRCGCDGDFHINLYHAERLLVSIGYHHNVMIRWRNGPWETDVDLTESAKKQVPEWFKKHGFLAMWEKYEAEKMERAQRQIGNGR